MSGPQPKRRRAEEDVRRPKKRVKKVKKQKEYHSSGEDEDDAVVPETEGVSQLESRVPVSTKQPKTILKRSTPAGHASSMDASVDAQDDVDEDTASEDELEKNTALNSMRPEGDSSEEDGSGDEPDIAAQSSADNSEDDGASESDASLTSSQASAVRRKRNDPDAFAESISRILGTKLTASKRADPVLSRSRSAAEANKTLAEGKLEQRARAQIRSEKRQALERGRVKDLLGLEDESVDTGRILEEEKRLKKTAQRGVVKLFNAVRAAQVQAEQARRDARADGVIGVQQREERVNEMSKQGFLDLISSGGRKTEAST